MSDQEIFEPKHDDGWTEVPRSESPSPQQPVPPQEPVDSREEDFDRLRAYQEDFHPEVPIQPEVVQFSSEQVPDIEFTSEPPMPPLYDPELDDRDPYSSVKPQGTGFVSAPAYQSAAPTGSVRPPAEKKNNTWIIVLIVLLVLCLCLVIGAVIVFFMVASGDYEIQWSYQLLNQALGLL